MPILPSSRACGWGYAFAEGWAHYTEEMMYERGLGTGDPEKHIGQLTDALLRDVRLLSAIGMHTGGMTVAQSEKMFSTQAFQTQAMPVNSPLAARLTPHTSTTPSASS